MLNETYKIAVQSTVYAIREHLMGYFKYSSGGRTTRSNVNLFEDSNPRGRHYVQQEYRIHNPSQIYIADIPICHLQKNPDTIELYARTLTRSKAMRDVCSGVEEFVAKYLRGVTVNTTLEGTSDWHGDKRAIMENKPFIPPAHPEQPELVMTRILQDTEIDFAPISRVNIDADWFGRSADYDYEP